MPKKRKLTKWVPSTETVSPEPLSTLTFSQTTCGRHTWTYTAMRTVCVASHLSQSRNNGTHHGGHQRYDTHLIVTEGRPPVNFGFLDEAFRRPVDWCHKQWLAGDAVVECNGALGFHDRSFQRCRLKVSSHFSKVSTTKLLVLFFVVPVTCRTGRAFHVSRNLCHNSQGGAPELRCI
jgi:hypothetical protein